MTTAERIAKLEQMLHNRCTPEIISELKETTFSYSDQNLMVIIGVVPQNCS